MTDESAALDLPALRAEIDRIDETIHRLLMERGLVIDRLIAAKRDAGAGSAFRPEREAAIMRSLGDRHRGALPLAAIEGIWRVIISTFTHVQAPFAVHAVECDDAVRDSARFHFGFSVPYRTHAGLEAVIGAVAGSTGDLGLLPIGPCGEAWWLSLEADDAPKVIARLPFLDRPDNPVATPLLVLARESSSEGRGAVRLYSARLNGAADDWRGLDAEVIAWTGDATLLALPSGAASGLESAVGPDRLKAVGGHPATDRRT